MEVWRGEVTSSKAKIKRQGQCGVLTGLLSGDGASKEEERWHSGSSFILSMLVLSSCVGTVRR